MSSRSEILNALKSLLQEVPDMKEVRRGIHYHEDMPTRPCVSFWNDKDTKTDRFGGWRHGSLHIILWGYTDVSADDYSRLDALVSDVEKALNTAMETEKLPDAVETLTVDTATIYEGGAENHIGAFDMEIEVRYKYRRDEL